MPPTRKKPRPTSTPGKQPKANGPPGDVLTLAEAAAYLRLAEQDVVAAVENQGLPGRLVGGQWRFLKTALQHWLSLSPPAAQPRNAALLAFAGAWKDDPYLEDMLEEIYRRRGRPITEDGSYRLTHRLPPGDGGQ